SNREHRDPFTAGPTAGRLRSAQASTVPTGRTIRIAAVGPQQRDAARRRRRVHAGDATAALRARIKGGGISDESRMAVDERACRPGKLVEDVLVRRALAATHAVAVIGRR